MILVEIKYKTYNNEFLAIIKVFKTWRHYLKIYKYEIFFPTDHNKLYCFINTKSLSSNQVCYAQKLFQYYFQVNYYQDKINAAKDTLLCFLQRSQDEKTEIQAKNGQSLYCL